MFPAGFIEAIFGWDAVNLTWWGPVAGWVLHLLLAIGIVCSKSRVVFYVLYGILGLILVLDVIGMHEDLVEFSKS